MKTTQDMHIWLNTLASLLGEEMLSIEQFTDKSFRISAHRNGDTVDTLYDSDDAMELIDINDLPYHDPKEFAEIIKKGKDLSDIGVDAL